MRTKVDFLNWRPDLDVYELDGLKVADNVLHGEDGYKPLALATAGAFTEDHSGSSFKVLPWGNFTPHRNNLAYAGVIENTTTTSSFQIGINNTQAFTSLTLGTLASLGAHRIKCFSLAEFDQAVVISAVVHASLDSRNTTYSLCGTFAYTVTSV